MSNPVLHAFFLGRALAEVLTETLEETLTSSLSELGKFDAEQREHLHQFIAKVQARAEQEVSQSTSNTAAGGLDSPADLQEMIDELRAEIARLRAELQAYRNPAS
jgi:uncharacterized small protein (DUF1192 family)